MNQERMMDVTNGIEPTLYIDIQQAPEKRCPVCGGAVYAPGYFCIRCERDGL